MTIIPKKVQLFTPEGEEYLCDVLKKLTSETHGLTLVISLTGLQVGVLDQRGMFAPLKLDEPDYFVDPAYLPELLERMQNEK